MRRILKKTRRFLSNVKQKLIYLSKRALHSKAVYWVLTPEHGNLGDHAIAQAEKLLFEAWGLETIELTGVELEFMKRRHLLSTMNGRTILVHGGGFMGTLWPTGEHLLREIIQKNPRSKIIVLPNTIYYEDSVLGRAELEKSVSIYNSHSRLIICAREQVTFSTACKLYNEVKLIPDMAMSLNYSDSTVERNGCLLCLRSDIEKTRTDEEEAIILKQVKSIFGNQFSYRDMCVNHSIPVETRVNELNKQYAAFQKSKLVITDRLHGMVFSAITGTPCIVLNSKSSKVRGCYEWIRHLNYIRFCDNVNNISTIYHSMPKGGQKYDNSTLMPYYDELKKIIMATMKER